MMALSSFQAALPASRSLQHRQSSCHCRAERAAGVALEAKSCLFDQSGAVRHGGETSPVHQAQDSQPFTRREALSLAGSATIFALFGPFLNSPLSPPAALAAPVTDEGFDAHVRAALLPAVSPSKAPGILRLVFHDAGPFDAATGTGGMNGSIRFELSRPENAGLKRSLRVLEKARADSGLDEAALSWADLIAVAGAVAVESCGGPHIPVAYGRKDASGPDPEGNMPAETFNADEVVGSFAKKGFSVQETVALLGAHTLGGKGFGQPTTFDNSYYTTLLEKPWLNTRDKMADMIGLPSDRAIVNDGQCLLWINAYAKDQDMFFKDFVAAYTKLVSCGSELA